MKITKKILACVLGFVMMLSLAACGGSIGNVPNNESHEEIFIDKAAEMGGNYLVSNVAYEFSLGDLGKMQVYVDTSDGHKFELDSANGGFLIQDSNGNEVLHVYCFDRTVYETLTSVTEEIKTVNGRKFFSSFDVSVYHLYSYLADCGIDAGMIMEAEDESAFRLVAFRGTPIEGASSDPYTYKGASIEVEVPEVEETPADEEPLVEGETGEEPISLEPGEGGTPNASMTTSTLSPEAESTLAALDTDYQRVLWGVRYGMAEEYPGLIISVTPYNDYGMSYLEVAITNLHDKPLAVTGKASALGAGDAIVGDTFIYTGAIGSGNTVIDEIYCGEGSPDGRIRWEDVQIDTDPSGEYVPWEADYAVSGNPSDGIEVAYSIYGANGDDVKPGKVTVFLLSADGFVVAKGTDYVDEEATKCENTMKIYGDEDALAMVKGLAMFVDSVK